jgi:hypothetical protein
MIITNTVATIIQAVSPESIDSDEADAWLNVRLTRKIMYREYFNILFLLF